MYQKIRNPDKLIKILEPVASEFVLSSYDALKSDMKRSAFDFTGYEMETVPSRVLKNPEQVIEHIEESESKYWLVTGSFFLVSAIGAILRQKNQ